MGCIGRASFCEIKKACPTAVEEGQRHGMYCQILQGPTPLITAGQSSRKHLHAQLACHHTLISPAQRPSHVKHFASLGYTTRPRWYQQRALAGSMQSVPVLKVVSTSWIGAALSPLLSECLLPCNRI